jgi:hypothetical protein
MILLKPSHVPITGIEVDILSAVELDFPKYNSTETEKLVGLTFSNVSGVFKVTADNFTTIAKHLQMWDFNKWIGKSIRIYQESKLIGGNSVLMIRVGEKLKRKKS